MRIGSLPFTNDIYQVHENLVLQENIGIHILNKKRYKKKHLIQKSKINSLEIEEQVHTHFWIDPKHLDRIYFNIEDSDKLSFNIEEAPFESEPSEISDLVEKTTIFGEVDAKESVLENQRSGKEEQFEEHRYKQQTHQTLLQRETIEEDTILSSSNLDLNKSLNDFVLDEFASLTPKQSKTIVYNSISNPNPNQPLIQSKSGPRIRQIARKSIRPQIKLPSTLRKVIKSWNYSSLETISLASPTRSLICETCAKPLDLNKNW